MRKQTSTVCPETVQACHLGNDMLHGSAQVCKSLLGPQTHTLQGLSSELLEVCKNMVVGGVNYNIADRRDGRSYCDKEEQHQQNTIDAVHKQA